MAVYAATNLQVSDITGESIEKYFPDCYIHRNEIQIIRIHCKSGGILVVNTYIPPSEKPYITDRVLEIYDEFKNWAKCDVMILASYSPWV